MDVIQEGAGRGSPDGEKTGRQKDFEGRRTFTGWCCHMGGRMEAQEAFLTIRCLKPIYLFIFIYI